MRPRPLLVPPGPAERDAQLAELRRDAVPGSVRSHLCAAPPTPAGYAEEVPGLYARADRRFHHGACAHVGRRSWPGLESAASLAVAGRSACAHCAPVLLGPDVADVLAYDQAIGPLRTHALELAGALEDGLMPDLWELPTGLGALYDTWVDAADVCAAHARPEIAWAWEEVASGLSQLFAEAASILSSERVTVIAVAAHVAALLDRRVPAGWDARSQWRLEELRRRTWQATRNGALPEEVLAKVPRRSRAAAGLLRDVLETAAWQATNEAAHAALAGGRFVATVADSIGAPARHRIVVLTGALFGAPQLEGRILGGRVHHRLRVHGEAPGVVLEALEALGV